MNNAKRYLVPSSILERANASFGEEVVLASDYAALEAEFELERKYLECSNALAKQLLDERDALAAEFKELAERYAKLQTGEDGLVSRVVAERDAALAELEAARKQSPIGHVALGSHTGVVFYSHMPQLPDGTKLYALPPLAGQVSVRRELLRRVCWPVVSGSDRHTHSEAVAELRALLATPSMEPQT